MSELEKTFDISLRKIPGPNRTFPITDEVLADWAKFEEEFRLRPKAPEPAVTIQLGNDVKAMYPEEWSQDAILSAWNNGGVVIATRSVDRVAEALDSELRQGESQIDDWLRKQGRQFKYGYMFQEFEEGNEWGFAPGLYGQTNVTRDEFSSSPVLQTAYSAVYRVGLIRNGLMRHDQSAIIEASPFTQPPEHFTLLKLVTPANP